MLRSKFLAIKTFAQHNLLKEQSGSASLEFLVTALVLLVPMLYLMIFLGEYQAKSFAAENITRQSAILLAREGNERPSDAVMADVLSSVSASFDIPSSDFSLTIACVSSTQSCSSSGDLGIVRAESFVTPPLIPDWFGLDRALSFRLVAEQNFVAG